MPAAWHFVRSIRRLLALMRHFLLLRTGISTEVLRTRIFVVRFLQSLRSIFPHSSFCSPACFQSSLTIPSPYPPTNSSKSVSTMPSPPTCAPSSAQCPSTLKIHLAFLPTNVEPRRPITPTVLWCLRLVTQFVWVWLPACHGQSKLFRLRSTSV